MKADTGHGSPICSFTGCISAYVRALGWERSEAYGDHSDVYAADRLPEIILPRTQVLGDYANVVSQLIEIFAKGF